MSKFWIPHSMDGGHEISVVHKSFDDGFESYGWGGEKKIIIFDSDNFGLTYENDYDPADIREDRELRLEIRRNKKILKYFEKKFLKIAEGLAKELDEDFPDGIK